MKTRRLIAVALLVAPFASALPTGEGGQGIQFLPKDRMAPVGKGVDDAQLMAMRDRTRFSGFLPEDSVPKGWDILEYSDFLGYDGNYVILPKGSVIHVPTSLTQHVLQKPEGQMMSWMDFSSRYRGLVTVLQVTMKQVTGEVAIPADRIEAAAKTNCLVVAVFEGSPITVLKAADPETSSNP